MGAVLVFSVGDLESFQKLKKWIDELREHTIENLVKINLFR
jgi:hypothetical protein